MCPLDGGMEGSEGLGRVPPAIVRTYAVARPLSPRPLNVLLGTKWFFGRSSRFSRPDLLALEITDRMMQSKSDKFE